MRASTRCRSVTGQMTRTKRPVSQAGEFPVTACLPECGLRPEAALQRGQYREGDKSRGGSWKARPRPGDQGHHQQQNVHWQRVPLTGRGGASTLLLGSSSPRHPSLVGRPDTPQQRASAGCLPALLPTVEVTRSQESPREPSQSRGI